MNDFNDSKDTLLAATCILLSVADADEILDHNETQIIYDILIDFFSLDTITVKSLVKESRETLEKSIDVFQFGKILNQNFNKQDKIDFISCIFEVAYSDGHLHYLEQHTIKKVANILNIHHNDLIRAKSEIKSYL